MRSAKTLLKRESDAHGTFSMPEVLVNIPDVLFCYIQVEAYVCEVGPILGPSVVILLSELIITFLKLHVNRLEKSGKAESMKEEMWNWLQQMNHHKKFITG